MDKWNARDPIERMQKYLQQLGIWSEEYENQVWEEARHRIQEATSQAADAPHPKWETLFDNVYETMPPALVEQRDALIERESHLEMTNEGEFPL